VSATQALTAALAYLRVSLDILATAAQELDAAIKALEAAIAQLPPLLNTIAVLEAQLAAANKALFEALAQAQAQASAIRDAQVQVANAERALREAQAKPPVDIATPRAPAVTASRALAEAETKAGTPDNVVSVKLLPNFHYTVQCHATTDTSFGRIEFSVDGGPTSVFTGEKSTEPGGVAMHLSDKDGETLLDIPASSEGRTGRVAFSNALEKDVFISSKPRPAETVVESPCQITTIGCEDWSSDGDKADAIFVLCGCDTSVIDKPEGATAV